MKRLAFFLFTVFLSSAAAADWCYEKDISYPKGMFGQFNDKKKTSLKKIDQFFKFGKETLPEQPHRMLYGLAYLEILVNELCFDRHNEDSNQAKNKINEIALDLRESLGMPVEMKRGKVINIYWSTGRLLELAEVKKFKIDEKRMENITKLREAKSSLKLALKRGLNEG